MPAAATQASPPRAQTWNGSCPGTPHPPTCTPGHTHLRPPDTGTASPLQTGHAGFRHARSQDFRILTARNRSPIGLSGFSPHAALDQLDRWPELLGGTVSALGQVMEFRLLGPVEVVINGKPVAIAASRQQIVLALLLLEVGHAVSV